MRIKVLDSYRGRPSKELEIQPGEYDADDPRLFGLADYLVTNGHAIVLPTIEETTPVEAKPEATRDEPPAETGEADVWNKPNPPEKPVEAGKRTKKVQ
jgi:hypothetical protein